MAGIESLKVTEVPAFLSDFADKHNRLVDLLAGLKGENGIEVTMAQLNGVIRANGNTTISNISGNVAFAVMSDGRLQNVYVGNTNGNQWPTAGKWVTASGNVDVSSTGVVVTSSGGKTANIAFASLTQNVSLREINICDNGTSKHMLILGSAAYT